MKINHQLRPEHLTKKISRLWEVSAPKILSIDKDERPGAPSSVYTIDGRYTARGWTEWTQGFVYGSMLLQFDATGDESFLQLGRVRTRERMAAHITHMGVHDHGFNNVSTYGGLWRMIREGRIAPEDKSELAFLELALKGSGAVQAARWTPTNDGGGFIYSFNGPHSLFADTIRSLRALALAHRLGHSLCGERDVQISLLGRLVDHAAATAKWSVYYGEGRDHYDVRGRVAHESIFNKNNGDYRCPNSQQGYSPFTTWTRGLAWIILGMAEELEFLDTVSDEELNRHGGRAHVEQFMLKAATATCDFYIDFMPLDGIPYWDTGAPLLYKLGEDYLQRPAQIHNDFEPVDSSAAAIAAQGLLRMGHYLEKKGGTLSGERYFHAGLTILDTLFDEPYLSTSDRHQGLILHSIYHQPNGWDKIPAGAKVPLGESSMWGDYHAREAAVYVQRLIDKKLPYYTFFGPA
ncbi:MAG: glycoside hydrolase family 88 protein [Verrucomicrobia bacterium]|nr:glycoside hydrolase family 88 protein [Verrucomicrobiota bacterium]